MKKDAKTMKEVAECCTKFCPCDDGCSCTNSSNDVSCRNCTHYTEKDVCDINLYAEIMKNHNF